MRKKKRGVLKKIVVTVLLAVILVIGVFLYRVKNQVDEVNAWRPTVHQVTQELGVADYEELVLSIILTETKGDHIDLMQSSESKYGETDQITNSEESIKTGVVHLTEVLTEAQQQEVDIWAGVQAYNFGSNYIPYVKQHGGKHSVELAEKYSKEVLAPMLGNTTEKTYRYLSLRAFKYNRGHLYENGGNFFYAELVRSNMGLMDKLSHLPWIDD